MRRLLISALLAVSFAVAAGCTPPTQRSVELFGPGCQVGVIGDSLIADARDRGGLARRFAASGCQVTEIAAVGGRTATQGAEVAEAWARTGRMPRILVVGLGTNDCDRGTFTAAARRILAAAGSRPVVWVNTWRVGCDHLINAAIGELPGVWVLDHHRWISADVTPLSADAVHLTGEGYARHAQRIVDRTTGRIG